jgi:hypothetical protein
LLPSEAATLKLSRMPDASVSITTSSPSLMKSIIRFGSNVSR